MADTIEVTSQSAVIEVNTPSKTIEIYKGAMGPQGIQGPPGATTIADVDGLQAELDSKAAITTLADASSTLLVNAGYF